MATYITEETPGIAQTWHCDTWGDFLTWVTSPKPDGAPFDSSHTPERGTFGGRSWYGTEDFDAAVKLARDGWREGADAVRSLSKRLETRLMHRIVKEEWVYDVEGQGFDVGRYLQGEPEHWHSITETDIADSGQKHVRIVYNISCSAGIDSKVIEARGATVCALIELLEYAGHRAELWVVDAAGHGRVCLKFAVKVKAYDQNLDPSRVAFAVAHPSMARRLLFSAFEHASVAIQSRIGMGYGTPMEYEMPETSLYVGSATFGDVQWARPDSAEAWIVGELAKQGVILRED